MALIQSFDPITDPHAHILILGSMPGIVSLRAQQYYAHPQNTFWKIMATLLQFDAQAPYALKIQALQRAHIALWDVLNLCIREGSLDTRIQAHSEIANNFDHFFATYPHIQHVFFNGAKAEACFNKHVKPTLDTMRFTFTRLPSTSPAHANLSFAQKLSAWRVVAH